MKTFKVWCPDDTDEDGADEIVAHDDEAAAEQWMRNAFDGEEIHAKVCVRAQDGTLTRVAATSEFERSYRAIRE